MQRQRFVGLVHLRQLKASDCDAKSKTARRGYQLGWTGPMTAWLMTHAIQWPRLDLYLGKKFRLLYRRGAGALAPNGLQAMWSSWRRGHNKAETDVDSLTAEM
ncbi:hypothetical protein WN944_000772 [Citrus x changshan-huyou]|uniref:Uncharacterized protein n=1 Tax=Citrus x changshan-huyou TaxID=2935761 RepID=A0AAP0MF69_9ROSI